MVFRRWAIPSIYPGICVGDGQGARKELACIEAERGSAATEAPAGSWNGVQTNSPAALQANLARRADFVWRAVAT